jgi:RecA-family ATPase
MEAFKPNGRVYEFCDPSSGAVRYRKERIEGAGGGKSFRFSPIGRNGQSPVLYGCERLADLAEGQPVFVVEGEKKVDRLRELGAVAVSGDSGASSRWLPAYADLLRGLHVVLWPDSDEPGEKYIANAAACLAGSAASLRVVRPFGKPNGAKGRDVCDWVGGPGELASLVEEADIYRGRDESHVDSLHIFSIASLAGKSIPLRQWLVPDVIPANQVTILSGNGGDGKSLLALQLAIAVVTETGWIGYMPELGTVLYASAEDDPDEIHRRVAAIVEGREDLLLGSMGGFNVIDLSATDAVLAAPGARGGILVSTPLFDQIKSKVLELRPSLLVIDALADVYGGDENIRGQVRQFISLLRQIALEHRVTVLLIAHPSLSGMATGSGTSGSTGWSNSVRSRLYLEPAVGDDGEANPYLRKLTVMKSNYAAKGTSILLEWNLGRFVIPGAVDPIERAASEAKEDARFLALLDAVTEQGRKVSPNPSHTWAPLVFSEMPEAMGMSMAKLKSAMGRLFRDRKIAVVESGPPSRRYSNVVKIN